MATKIYVNELREGDFVQSTFLVVERSLRTSRGGDPFLRLQLADRTGTIEGRVWTDPEAVASRIDGDDFAALRGEVTRFGDTLHVNVADLDRVPDAAVDLADFLPTSRWRPEALFEQLRGLLSEELHSPEIRAFLDALFTDDQLTTLFCTAPAAMSNHHAYLGGLLEHCLSMCRVALRLADHYALYYPGLLNRDLLLAGVILHDFAKVWELSYRRSFDYTTQGRLVGHIAMGAEHIARVAANARRPISEDLQMHLKHLVLAHHGELEYGSPVKPMTPEALLLHQVDMIDSRMNMLAAEREATHDPAAAESWSEFRRSLGARILFRGSASSAWESAPKPRDLAGPGLGALATPTSPPPTTLNLFDDES